MRASATLNKCLRPDCSRPAHNNEKGKFCSFLCRDAGCLTPGCTKSPYVGPGKPGLYCSLGCKASFEGGAAPTSASSREAFAIPKVAETSKQPISSSSHQLVSREGVLKPLPEPPQLGGSRQTSEVAGEFGRFVWQWRDDSGQWQDYGAENSFLIEQSLKMNKTTCKVTTCKGTMLCSYELDLQQKKQRLEGTKLWNRDIQRVHRPTDMPRSEPVALEAAIDAFSLPRWSDSGVSSVIALWQGSITRLRVDAIVNAANEALAPGGGVCGAIHKAAGPLLANECAKIGFCQTGSSVSTSGFNLPAKNVIHTVAPVVVKDAILLQNCYRSVLDLAMSKEMRSVAFCCVGTGIFGFPLVDATHIALHTIRQWLEDHPGTIELIVLVMFMQEEFDVYEKTLRVYFPKQEGNLEEDTEVPPHERCDKCRRKRRSHAFVPCGDLSVCGDCAQEIERDLDYVCSRCGAPVDSVMHIKM